MFQTELRVWQALASWPDTYMSVRRAGGGPWQPPTWVSVDQEGRIDLTPVGQEWGIELPLGWMEVFVWQGREGDRQSAYVTLRREGEAWQQTLWVRLDQENQCGTYRYGDFSVAVPLPAPTPEPTVMLPPAPEVFTVSDGSHDELLLEWTWDAPEEVGASGWQYRMRVWENREPLAWGSWTDVPNSTNATRSYRLTGLAAEETYDFQVRALVGTVAGAVSKEARGVTEAWRGRPTLANQIVEGDGRTEWQVGDVAFVIPAGMQLRAGPGWVAGGGGCSIGTPIDVVGGGGGLSVCHRGTDPYISVHIDPNPPPDSVCGGGRAAEIEELLDQLVASSRVLSDSGDVTPCPEVTCGSSGWDTLGQVFARDRLKCGVKQTQPLFGYLEADGTVVGFDIEFCKALAAAVLKDHTKVEYVDASDASTRFELLAAAEIDVLIRTTTITASRDREQGVDFAHPIFYGGQGFAVRKDSGIESTQDMADAIICVRTGTLLEQNVANHFADIGLEYDPRGGLGADYVDVADAFFAGRCDVLTMDVGNLGSWIAVRDDADDYKILPQIISKEPLAPGVRDYDSEWKDVVNWVVHGLVRAEEIGITRANVDQMAANPPNTEVARLLGVPYEGSEVAALGFDSVDPQFIQRAIAAVGNYGEIYDRTIGDTIARACTLNDLVINNSGCPDGQGGIMYALPFR